MHLLIRHRVADFAKWKPAYDAHQSKRNEAGPKEALLLRGADDPSVVVPLLSDADLAKAKAFVSSPDLRETMKTARVMDQPEILSLD